MEKGTEVMKSTGPGVVEGALRERESQESRSAGLGRRDFLLAGTASVVGGMTLTLPAGAAGSATAERSTNSSTLSVGYWNGSAQALGGSHCNSIPTTVTAANRITADGINLLRHDASVMVHGLFGERPGPETEALEFMVHYRIGTPAGEQVIPFHAWHYHAGDVPRISNPARFVLPVHPDTGLSFALMHRVRVARQTGGERVQSSETTCRLALSGTHATGGLRPGVYLFAPGDPHRPDTLNWSGLVFLPDNMQQGKRRLFRRTLQGMKPVGFPYLIVSIVPSQGGEHAILS
jgi:hypothetical protein